MRHGQNDRESEENRRDSAYVVSAVTSTSSSASFSSFWKNFMLRWCYEKLFQEDLVFADFLF